MAAVLKRVVDDCGDVQHRRKAVAYAASHDRGWPFSFANLCEGLGLDADRLRETLLNGPSSMKGHDDTLRLRSA